MPNPRVGVPERITDRPAANLPLAGDEIVPIVQNDTVRQVMVSVIRWLSAGPTAQRPIFFPGAYVGWMHYDTDLLIPVWWSGLDWRDAAGILA